MNNNKIIFVCGALRSGTTLLHLMLNSHPNIKNPGEFDFLFDMISENGDFPDIHSYHNFLETHRIFNSTSLIINKQLSYKELIYSFIHQLQSDNKNVLALNIHRNFDRIPYLFPTTRYIHLIRDPRDVARSSIGMGWSGNVFHGVDHWIDSENSWKKLQKNIAPKQYYTLKFEDLILAPKKTLHKLCAFMEVDYSNNMMNYDNTSTYSKPDPALVEQWKTKLSKKEIQLVEYKAQNLLQGAGYQLSNEPLTDISLLERFKLQIDNKIFRSKFSIKRYGFFIWFTGFISRLLHFHGLNKQNQIKMNEIDKLYLK